MVSRKQANTLFLQQTQRVQKQTSVAKNTPGKGQKFVFCHLAAFSACSACYNVEYKEYPRVIYGSGIFKFLILIYVSFKVILQNQMAYLKQM